MARWQPDAEGRLRDAALALFLERGYDQTTVADIADRAGLTARTFFRYYADKREVLFAGSGVLQERLVAAVASAPSGASPLAAVGLALAEAASLLGADRAFARDRNAVITSSPELRERERTKLATLGTALAEALVARGVEPLGATLAGEAGVAVLRVAFERWIDEAGAQPLAAVMGECLGRLTALAAETGRPTA